MEERGLVVEIYLDYNGLEARGNVKLLEEMFGKGGENPKEHSAHEKPAAPKIGNVKPKTTGPPHSETGAKKHDESHHSKEVLELQHKLESVRQVLMMNEHPLNIVNHLRQMFDLPIQHMDGMMVETHGSQDAGNPMDIESPPARERSTRQLKAEADLLMDEDLHGLN